VPIHVKVVSGEDYSKWVQEQLKNKAAAGADGAAKVSQAATASVVVAQRAQ